jgi:hypothetical protein
VLQPKQLFFIFGPSFGADFSAPRISLPSTSVLVERCFIFRSGSEWWVLFIFLLIGSHSCVPYRWSLAAAKFLCE